MANEKMVLEEVQGMSDDELEGVGKEVVADKMRRILAGRDHSHLTTILDAVKAERQVRKQR